MSGKKGNRILIINDEESLEDKDKYTNGHSAIGLDQLLLHDIGRIGIQESMLDKPSGVTTKNSTYGQS